MQVIISGTKFAYEDINRVQTSKPAVLMIHGYPFNRYLWNSQVQNLSTVTRLIIPDLRGFGGSEATSGIFSMDMLANDCNNLLEACQIDQPVIVCGLSMGGYIAFSMYKNHPERVKALILISTRSSADTLEAKANRNKAIRLAEKEGIEAISRVMLPKMLAPKTYLTKPRIVDRVQKIMGKASVPGILGVLAGMRDRQDSTSLLPSINVPTILIFGNDDPFIPRKEIDEMQSAIPNSQLYILLNAGHLVNIEHPILFNKIVRNFITSLK